VSEPAIGNMRRPVMKLLAEFHGSS